MSVVLLLSLVLVPTNESTNEFAAPAMHSLDLANIARDRSSLCIDGRPSCKGQHDNEIIDLLVLLAARISSFNVRLIQVIW